MNKIIYIIPFWACLFCTGTVSADEWDGKQYSRHSSVQLTHAERMLNGIALRGDEKILDVGCGDGKISLEMAHRIPVGSIIGIDSSESMLNRAQEHKKGNLAFFQMSAEDFSFSERFDHIYAIHVMHWIVNQDKALKNIYSHLRPKGQVHFILAPSKEGLPFHSALLQTIANWRDDFDGFVNPQQVYDVETYRKLMVNAGFHIESMHYVFHESIHEDKNRLKLWLEQWLPHGKFLPKEKRDLFFAELMNHYLTEAGYSPDELGPVKWGEYVLIVHAKKAFR